MKQECIESLASVLKGTATWRKGTAARFPDDGRNMRAAYTLEKLAVEAADLTDAQWLELQRHYSWESKTWRDAVNQTARQVGFAFRAGDLDYFVRELVKTLSLLSVAA